MQDTKEAPHLMTVPELAHTLAVPESWVYARTAAEDIPHVHVGRYVRFNINAVMKWLEADRVPAGR